MQRNNFITHYPPYIHDWRTSGKAAWICVCTLVPVVLWSARLYGNAVLYVWMSAVLPALLSEALICAVKRSWTLGDGSAVLTGMLIAMAMPPSVAWYIPALSACFALLIIKGAFGGLGSNWMNPAAGGIAFAYANWPNAMREFIMPKLLSGADAISAATPTSLARNISGGLSEGIMASLHAASYPLSSTDMAVTTFLNDTVFSKLGGNLPNGYIDLLLGYRPGPIGESALFAILAGSILIAGLRLIKLFIPLSMVATYTLLVGLFGTGLNAEQVFAGDALFALSASNIILAAFYMASDPVTSPVSRLSCSIYGAGIALLCYAFRRWGAYPDGAAYALLIMNVTVPLIDSLRSAAHKKTERPHL